jgi:hypothetical protein
VFYANKPSPAARTTTTCQPSYSAGQGGFASRPFQEKAWSENGWMAGWDSFEETNRQKKKAAKSKAKAKAKSKSKPKLNDDYSNPKDKSELKDKKSSGCWRDGHQKSGNSKPSQPPKKAPNQARQRSAEDWTD